jgi:hypothetical protein
VANGRNLVYFETLADVIAWGSCGFLNLVSVKVLESLELSEVSIVSVNFNCLG